MSVLALDLGGTKLATAVFSDGAELLESDAVPLEGRTGDEVGKLIVDQIEHLSLSRREEIQSIGVCIPGISRSLTGTVWAPNIRGWEDYPLRDVIRRAFPTTPVAIDNDRACSILGEHWRGVAQGSADAIFIAVGTGIGAGILSGGNLIRGREDIAGAVGWLALKGPFEEKYVSCGCFEYYASGDGIARYAEELLNTDTSYRGGLRQRQGKLKAHDVFEAQINGDALAEKVLRACVDLWGMAAANLVSIFNPSKVIFGGGVFGPAARFIPAIYEEAVKWAQPISIRQVHFEQAALGDKAAIFGAGYLALKNMQRTDRL